MTRAHPEAADRSPNADIAGFEALDQLVEMAELDEPGFELFASHPSSHRPPAPARGNELSVR
jgi:hypothetical protein